MSKVENWRKIILSINDNSFFDLMRNYLGKIETPFNKQDLINRLINFFNREETKDKILNIISSQDASLLTAIHLIKGPSDTQLHNVFHDWSYLDLHNRIQNLEERFLIFKKENSYYMTPIFKDLFLEKVISPSLLIETMTVENSFDPLPWLNDPLMLALLAFIQKNKNLIKIDGNIKKRGIAELENVFPTLFSGEDGLKRFELCTSVLTNLNLVESNEGVICTNMEQWYKLASYSEMQRYCMYYGAALSANSNETNEMTTFFTDFLNHFPKDMAIHKLSLNRYYKLYCEKHNSIYAPFKLNKISDVLKSLTLLIDVEDYVKINSLLDFFHEEKHSEPPLVIQPNFEITVKPFIDLQKSILLANAMEIRKYDLFSHFTLNRESFLRAFDKGIKSEEILEKLKDLSEKEIPQNVRISLKDWEEDHRKVKLYTGVVLKVSEDKQMLIEKTDFMKPFILEILAPGVYLLDSDQEKLWMEALGELSISPLPANNRTDGNCGPISAYNEKVFVFENALEKRRNWNTVDSDDNSRIEAQINGLLTNLSKSGIQGDEKKEIEARIKRKLIIMESQINRGIIRPEITEAKGMNFQGKVRLIESALSNKSDRLELSHYTTEGVHSILVQRLNS